MDSASSTQALIGSVHSGEDSFVSMLEHNVVVIRPETREFYQHLDTFFELRQTIEGVVDEVMPDNALHKYEDINPASPIMQQGTPGRDLLTQLDILYSLAKEAKPKFDDFGRQVVQLVGLDPDMPMLEQATQTWCTYTAAPLKARERAMEKAQNEYECDARRLVDIVRASVVIDTEAAFEAVVKCLNENYATHERDGVRIVRFKNRCKKPLADGQRDVLYNIGIMLHDSPSPFVCELQIHMKQILDYKEATHGPYHYFRSYFKSGDGKAVTERMELLEKFARRDADDISQIVTTALSSAHDLDQLDALDELFLKLSELEIVVLIRNRLLNLASSHVSPHDVEEGSDWLTLAQRLYNLARALYLQGKYDEAKPLYERSLRIRETNLGEHHPDVASSLHCLAGLLDEQGKYDEVKPLYERSLRIRETNLGKQHLGVSDSLNNLAILLMKQGKYDEAKPPCERSLRIREANLGEHHPLVATSLNNLGELLKAQGKCDEAKPLIERSLRIKETTLGEHHTDVASSLNNLAALLCQQGKYDEAKLLYERSLRIKETNLGEHHPTVATALNNIGELLRAQGEYDEAKPLIERSLRIRETNLGEHHRDVASSLNNLGELLRAQGKYDEARPLYERSLRIRQTHLGEHHRDVASSLNNLGELLRAQGKYDEAKPLIERSLQIRETNLGEHHPDVASSLNNLALLLQQQGKRNDAQPLHERSLRIRETRLGKHHPDIAETLLHLADLARDEGRLAHAAQIVERATHIFQAALGPAHPHTLQAHRIYADIASRLKAQH